MKLISIAVFSLFSTAVIAHPYISESSINLEKRAIGDDVSETQHQNNESNDDVGSVVQVNEQVTDTSQSTADSSVLDNLDSKHLAVSNDQQHTSDSDCQLCNLSPNKDSTPQTDAQSSSLSSDGYCDTGSKLLDIFMYICGWTEMTLQQQLKEIEATMTYLGMSISDDTEFECPLNINMDLLKSRAQAACNLETMLQDYWENGKQQMLELARNQLVLNLDILKMSSQEIIVNSGKTLKSCLKPERCASFKQYGSKQSDYESDQLPSRNTRIKFTTKTTRKFIKNKKIRKYGKDVTRNILDDEDSDSDSDSDSYSDSDSDSDSALYSDSDLDEGLDSNENENGMQVEFDEKTNERLNKVHEKFSSMFKVPETNIKHDTQQNTHESESTSNEQETTLLNKDFEQTKDNTKTIECPNQGPSQPKTRFTVSPVDEPETKSETQSSSQSKTRFTVSPVNEPETKSEAQSSSQPKTK
ncbi:hypothetical protein BATDEDRAFT_25310 [Batrachochytrium dendrobatidis JAM81]|uniref:Uncharacterized protein n=1 Tax=Batrachochytrium dendrobatidis (strain JAM81 / FGSC 10211) TaxID=684364 RepID=F4P4J9_BATDJ|nr:uncharacterized protein BATDEDRAFT_25310 [Batrachochytrium dendrobatidis JAM81]EGF79639.1 hypothetical protein BATDEDRAFT_25310 [Batrachochytrium dendrobatidis JAM81]|eukprot:XP_006679420.1 hypothetical protein BATDEDRAFT_25310 [Batrachochytrium dendrobatidis JAM81]